MKESEEYKLFVQAISRIGTTVITSKKDGVILFNDVVKAKEITKNFMEAALRLGWIEEHSKEIIDMIHEAKEALNIASSRLDSFAEDNHIELERLKYYKVRTDMIWEKSNIDTQFDELD
jgi:aspartate/methionine/tyrosine aminotransferase